MEKIILALDWTPNINHIGFLVAQAQGFYKEIGLDVHIEHPGLDNYAVTPAKKVENGIADFALCPTESILSYRTKSQPFPLIAVAAILQEDLSAIVVRSQSGMRSPQKLDGKTYASYKARYEDEIVKQMIVNDGGRGDLKLEYPEKLGIWETLVQGDLDATWVFVNWEGVQMKDAPLDFTYFKMEDYKIPYSYSPVIAANENLIKGRGDSYRDFLTATKKGYAFCKDHPENAVAILYNHIPERDRDIDLNKALEMSVDAFGIGNSWGVMRRETVATFLDWLYEKKLETQVMSIDKVMTNELL